MNLKLILQSCAVFIWFTILTGAVYPLVITGLASLFGKEISKGSLLVVNGKKIGSELIGQNFADPRYFWSRPSSIDYEPLPSGGSNLSPRSLVLKKKVAERKEFLAKAHEGKNNVPENLLFSSGSGVDPHITLAAAIYQLDRISKNRSLDKLTLKKLVDLQIKHPYFGFFGEPYVNVLKLNIQLDWLSASKENKHE